MNLFFSRGFNCPQSLPLFNDETTPGQKPHSEALMGHEQKLPVDKVHSGVNIDGILEFRLPRGTAFISWDTALCNPFCEFMES